MKHLTDQDDTRTDREPRDRVAETQRGDRRGENPASDEPARQAAMLERVARLMRDVDETVGSVAGFSSATGNLPDTSCVTPTPGNGTEADPVRAALARIDAAFSRRHEPRIASGETSAAKAPAGSFASLVEKLRATAPVAPLVRVPDVAIRLTPAPAATATEDPLTALRADIASLTGKFEAINSPRRHREVLAGLRPLVKTEMTRLNETVGALATRQDIAALQRTVHSLADAALAKDATGEAGATAAEITRLADRIDAFTPPVDPTRHLDEIAISMAGIREALAIRASASGRENETLTQLARHVADLAEETGRIGARTIDPQDIAAMQAALVDLLTQLRTERRGEGSAEGRHGAAVIAELGDKVEVLSARFDVAARAIGLDDVAAGQGEPALDFNKRLNLISHKLDILSKTQTIDLVDQIEALGGKIDDLARTRPADARPAMADLEARLEAKLETTIHDAVARHAPTEALGAIEGQILGLADRIESLCDRDMNAHALDALQCLIETLSQRPAGRDTDAATGRMLGSLDLAMRQLADEVVGLRAETAEVAARAARVAIADTLGAVSALSLPKAERSEAEDVRRDIETLRLLQDEAERRTRATLDAVHETLIAVVQRFARLEEDGTARPSSQGAAQVPSRASPAAGAETGPAAASSAETRRTDLTPAELRTLEIFTSELVSSTLAARDVTQDGDAAGAAPVLSRRNPADEPLEPGSGRPAGRLVASSDPIATSPNGEPTGADSADPDVKARFIAAARRAAKTAAVEATPDVAAGPIRTGGAKIAARPAPGKKKRAGAEAGSPVTRLRQALDSRRKTMLLAVAAIVIAAGVSQFITSVVRPGNDHLAGIGAPPQTAGSIDSTGNSVFDPPTTGSIGAPAGPTPDLTPASPPDSPPANPFLVPPAAQPEDRFEPTRAVRPDPGFEKQRDAKGRAAPGETPARAAVPALIPNMAAIGEIPATSGTPGLRKAVLAGNPLAVHELGARLADGRTSDRELKLAAKLFEKAASAGLVPAQYRLAAMYEKGIGVPRDPAIARGWYERAAAAGHTKAMHNLAVLLSEGIDGRPDYAAAVAWFRRGAEYGIRDSQYNLAVLLARGLGAPQDLVESYTWFAIAATQGDEDAGRKRDEVAARLNAADLAAARGNVSNQLQKVPDRAANEVVPPPGGWESPKGTASKPGAKEKVAKAQKI